MPTHIAVCSSNDLLLLVSLRYKSALLLNMTLDTMEGKVIPRVTQCEINELVTQP